MLGFKTGLITGTLTAFLAVVGLAEAQEAQEGPEAAARQFWAAVSTANPDAMKPYYAPSIRIHPGSELLKNEWGVVENADRGRPVDVDRDDLIGGYSKMFTKLGAEKWRAVFSKIGTNQQKLIPVTENDKPIAGVRVGDHVFTVATGPGDDTLHYVFRKAPDARWLVHAEATDY